MVCVFLATGFEEIEALTPVDLLRRVGIEVKTVAVGDSAEDLTVKGARGIPVVCDYKLNEVLDMEMEIAVLPGGMPGTINLLNCRPLMDMIDRRDAEGKRIAAICAAPAKLLGERGLLKGRRATCYPGMEELMEGATACTDSVVTDGHITTARGMGTAMDFGLEMVKLLISEEKAAELAKSVVA